MLVVDDSHGVGVLGSQGRGTHEHFGLVGKIDIITGTLGKALGGAAGRIRRRVSKGDRTARATRLGPACFPTRCRRPSPTAPTKRSRCSKTNPTIVARLHANVATIRNGLADLGFDCPPSPTAIIPIMIGDEAEAIRKSAKLFELGVMVIGFGFPVVPKGEARLRVQVSAALTDEHIQQALDAFAKL